MNRIKVIFLGAITGMGIGLLNAILAVLGWLILASLVSGFGSWTTAVSNTLLLFCLIQGLIVGAINACLCLALVKHEQIIVSILLSLAIGAARIMIGGYANDSLLPIAIYSLSCLNGLVAATIIMPLSRRAIGEPTNNMLIG